MKDLNKKIKALLQIFLMVFTVFTLVSFNSQEVKANPGFVCCEKTTVGNYCQYVDESLCALRAKKAATSCDKTSFCKLGCGFDLKEGRCWANTPKAIVENMNATFGNNPNCDDLSQCKLGCCIIGTEASLTTEILCKKSVAPYPDIQMIFKSDVTNEAQCLNLARSQEQGCCVIDADNCKYGTRNECSVATAVNITAKQGFYKDTYCSDLRLGCHCTPKQKKGCVDEDVYWFDSCGNKESIVKNGDKGSDGKIVEESGDCDYAEGTMCGQDKTGNYRCLPLDCNTAGDFDSEGVQGRILSFEFLDYQGTSRAEIEAGGTRHGESWCITDSAETVVQSTNDKPLAGRDLVGSRYYRALCINSKEFIEPCADFRKEYCISGSVPIKLGEDTAKFTEARCVENNWKPCVTECNKADASTMDGGEYQEQLKKDMECCTTYNKGDCKWLGNKCSPLVSPSFKFWENEGADVCGSASISCPVVLVCNGWDAMFGCTEKDDAKIWAPIIGGVAGAVLGFATGGPAGAAVGALLSVIDLAVKESQPDKGWNIMAGKECLTEDFLQAANNLCRSYGDCGADYNYKNELSLKGINFKEKLDDRYRSESVTKLITGYADLVKKFNEQTIKPNWDSEGARKFFDTTKKSGYKDDMLGRFWNKFFNVASKEFWRDNLLGISPTASIAPVIFVPTGALPGLAPGTPLGLILYYPVKGIISLISKETAKKMTIMSSFKETVKLEAEAVMTKSALAPDKIAKEAEAIINKKVLEVGSKLELEKEAVMRLYTKKTYFVNIPEAELQSLSPEVRKAVYAGSKPGAGMKEFNEAFNAGKKSAEELAKETAKKTAEGEAKKQAEGVITAAGEDAAKEWTTTWTWSGAWAGVNAAMWVDTAYELINVLAQDTKVEEVKATCQPWQPLKMDTTKKEQCERCNPEYYIKAGNIENIRALKKCDEYACKTLGAGCELLNKGTGNETCVNIAKDDVSSPTIEPWQDGFADKYSFTQIPEGEGYKRGYMVSYDKPPKINKVPIYTSFTIGIKNNEPAQCKMSLKPSIQYKDMTYYFGGNLYSYYKSQFINFPSQEIQEPGKIARAGNYTLYVKCEDAAGNANNRDYIIKINVETGPDMTAPLIEGTSIDPGSYFKYQAKETDLILSVNEIAKCRWDARDAEFKNMDSKHECATAGKNELNLYSCTTKLTGLIDDIENKFYLRCNDTAGNLNTKSYLFSLKGSTPLKIRTIQPETDSTLYEKNITLRVETDDGAHRDGTATCKFSTINRQELMADFENTGTATHTQELTPEPGKYTYYIMCYDAAGNTIQGETTFTVAIDTEAPKIVRIYEDTSYTPSHLKIIFDENTFCEYSNKDFLFGEGTKMPEDNTKEHDALYAEGTSYYIRCKDSSNNFAPLIIVYT